MLKNGQKVFLTGFMGVGKSTVARHLAHMLKCRRIDLDSTIEKRHGKTIAELIQTEGIERFRELESEALERVLAEESSAIVALGGGAFTIERNREAIKRAGDEAVWLESTFEHCWMNIQKSKRVRPLAKDKTTARNLFEERQKSYCLAGWHFIIRPGLDSRDIAKQIAEEVFNVE